MNESSCSDENLDNLDQFISAIKSNDLPTIQKMIKEGFNITKDGIFLKKSIKYGNLKILRFLIENGSDINLCARYGGIPLLHYAVKKKTT